VRNTFDYCPLTQNRMHIYLLIKWMNMCTTHLVIVQVYVFITFLAVKYEDLSVI